MASNKSATPQFYGMVLDEEQAAFVDAIKDQSKTIVFCDAPAGTGKTTLAMIEVGMNPNTDVCGESMTAKKRGEGFVKLLTHTYLRGTNLQNKVVILDESQNYTVAELKKVLTRCHDSCKVIVIGHTGQIDIRGGSGFAKYLEHFQGQERCAVCKLTTNHRGWLSTFADMLEG